MHKSIHKHILTATVWLIVGTACLAATTSPVALGLPARSQIRQRLAGKTAQSPNRNGSIQKTPQSVLWGNGDGTVRH